MLKKLRRQEKQLALFIDALEAGSDLVELSCPTAARDGVEFGKRIKALHASCGLKNDDSQNPNFLTYYQPDLSRFNLSYAEKNALAWAIAHTSLEADLDSPKEALWFTLAGTYTAYLGFTPIFLSKNTNGKIVKHFYLRIPEERRAEFAASLARIGNLPGIDVEFFMQSADQASASAALRARHKEAVDFYIEKDPEWLKSFYQNLGDNLSRAALASFLKQRMAGKVLWDCDILYALQPTPESAGKRIKSCQARSSWPYLHACGPSLPFMIYNTFLMEQYKISGVAEAKPGDTVLDIGAGYGDTTIFFAHNMNNEGKVLAIDPFEENVRKLAANVHLHGCGNVIPMTLGISDKDENSWVYLASDNSSTVAEIRNSSGRNSVPVQLTTVDTLAKNQKIHFIKADIEGAEGQMLIGAEKTIKRDRPTLALALYHKEDDFMVLPKMLSGFNPDYTYFIRLDAEPMFFAVDKSKLENCN